MQWSFETVEFSKSEYKVGSTAKSCIFYRSQPIWPYNDLFRTYMRTNNVLCTSSDTFPPHLENTVAPHYVPVYPRPAACSNWLSWNRWKMLIVPKKIWRWKNQKVWQLFPQPQLYEFVVVTILRLPQNTSNSNPFLPVRQRRYIKYPNGILTAKNQAIKWCYIIWV